MTTALPKEANLILAALKENDPGKAQALLERSDALFPFAWKATVQARIHLAEREPDKAIQVIHAQFGTSPDMDVVAMLLARAYLDAGNPGDALQVADGIASSEETSTSPAEQRFRIAVHAALNDREKTIAWVNQVQANDAGAAQSVFHLGALVKVAAIDEAVDLIAKQPNLIACAGAAQCFGECLREGRQDLVARFLPAILGHFGLFSSPFIRASIQHAVSTASDHDIERNVDVMVEETQSLESVYCIANALFAEGLETSAEKAVVRFQTLCGTQGSGDNKSASFGSRSGPLIWERRAAKVMDWLEIPDTRRERWLESANGARTDIRQRNFRLCVDPSFVEEFRSQLAPVDLSPLRILAAQNRPAILATAHAGVLSATLQYLEMHDVPAYISGGEVVMHRVVPGGYRLDPSSRSRSSSYVSRQILKRIRSGEIVALPADAMLNARSMPIPHHGLTLNVPDFIPRYAVKHQLPVVWMVSYWRDNQIVCDCEKAPSPDEGEALASYREKWCRFVLDKLRKISLADPRNAVFDFRMLQGALD